MTYSRPDTIVIGVGNEFRGDDGVGIAVARKLHDTIATEVPVLEQSGEGTTLMDAWQGATCVILVDAVYSGGAPGTIHRIDTSAALLPASLFPCSTHAFGVADAIEIARALHQLPPTMIVYGIEGVSFDEVRGLTIEVQSAVDAVCARILEEVLCHHLRSHRICPDEAMR